MHLVRSCHMNHHELNKSKFLNNTNFPSQSFCVWAMPARSTGAALHLIDVACIRPPIQQRTSQLHGSMTVGLIFRGTSVNLSGSSEKPFNWCCSCKIDLPTKTMGYISISPWSCLHPSHLTGHLVSHLGPNPSTPPSIPERTRLGAYGDLVNPFHLIQRWVQSCMLIKLFESCWHITKCAHIWAHPTTWYKCRWHHCCQAPPQFVDSTALGQIGSSTGSSCPNPKHTCHHNPLLAGICGRMVHGAQQE